MEMGFTFLYTFILLNYLISILIDAYTRLRNEFKAAGKMHTQEMQHFTVCLQLCSSTCRAH